MSLPLHTSRVGLESHQNVLPPILNLQTIFCTIYGRTDGWPHRPEVKRVIALKALDRFKGRIREITRRAKGVSMETTMEELAPSVRGWRSYFGFCETPEVLIYLTRGVRLRLRATMWRQWKTNAPSAVGSVGTRGASAAGKQHLAVGSTVGTMRRRSLVCRALQCLLQIPWLALIIRGNAVYGPVCTVVFLWAVPAHQSS
jgi:hypothetical protein